jgi:hypothetical protein
MHLFAFCSISCFKPYEAVLLLFMSDIFHKNLKVHFLKKGEKGDLFTVTFAITLCICTPKQ